MKVQKNHILLFLFIGLVWSTQSAFAISTKELGDSLNAYTDFPEFIPKVKVKNLRVNKLNVNVYTNKTLSALSLSPEELTGLRKKVSQWVLGTERGHINIYSDGYELGDLITDRFRTRKEHYTLPARRALDYTDRAWSAPNGLDERTIALWPSHGMYYNSDLNMWHWQRARMWTMVEDLYSYEFTHTWLIPMLENAGAYILEPRAREGRYYKKDSVWLWLGDRIAPEGAETRFIDSNMPGIIARGSDSITSGRPIWMEGARYWLEYTGFPEDIWNKNNGSNDYKDDLQSRGLWVNYLTGGSRANPKQDGLGIQVDACLALHTDGYTAPHDSDYIGTLAIYTNHDDDNRKVFPTGTSRIVCRDLADYVQTQIVGDIRATVAPQWTRRELLNSGYCESRYPVVPTLLLEVLSHKNPADIMLGLDPTFQAIFCRAIYKGLGRWMMGNDFVVQPLPVHGLGCYLEGNTCHLSWEATPDTLEPSAMPTYYIVYQREENGEWDNGTHVNDTHYHTTLAANQRYDFRVVAGNTGGISMQGETISARAASTPTTLYINNFHRISGPDWYVDSLTGGIVPGSYPVPYLESRTYLGDQWIYAKQRNVKENGWTDDDNCGWGMCHMDYVGKVLDGNPMCVPYITDSGSYIVCSSEGLSALPADAHFTKIELYCGQERGQIYSTDLQLFLEKQLTTGADLVIRGTHLGSGLHTSEKKWAEKILGYTLAAPRATVPEGKHNAPDAIKPASNQSARVIARYPDTGLPSALEITRGASTITIICE